jgi:outer membrane lipoprotein-sorting protein
MQKPHLGFLILAIASALPSIAAAQDARQILERMEKTINGFDDQTMEVAMTVVDVDGSRKSYEFTIWQKGDTRRLIRFTSGEMKGMATLVEDRNRVHVYLPGFKKVRRVAANNMKQSFAGSDFSTNDMASASWTAIWDAAIEREDPGYWYLRCTPRPGVDSEYAKAIVKVEKRRYLQMGVEYFDEAGTRVKVFDNREVRTFHGVDRASEVSLTDARTGHRTELRVKEFTVNQGLPESMFTVRELEWGK